LALFLALAWPARALRTRRQASPLSGADGVA
jgi:hypothetical protein